MQDNLKLHASSALFTDVPRTQSNHLSLPAVKKTYFNVCTQLCNDESLLFKEKHFGHFMHLYGIFVALILESQRKRPCPREFAGSTGSILGTGLNCNHQGNHFVAFLMLAQPMCNAARASIQSRNFSILSGSNNSYMIDGWETHTQKNIQTFALSALYLWEGSHSHVY